MARWCLHSHQPEPVKHGRTLLCAAARPLALLQWLATRTASETLFFFATPDAHDATSVTNTPRPLSRRHASPLAVPAARLRGASNSPAGILLPQSPWNSPCRCPAGFAALVTCRQQTKAGTGVSVEHVCGSIFSLFPRSNGASSSEDASADTERSLLDQVLLAKWEAAFEAGVCSRSRCLLSSLTWDLCVQACFGTTSRRVPPGRWTARTGLWRSLTKAAPPKSGPRSFLWTQFAPRTTPLRRGVLDLAGLQFTSLAPGRCAVQLHQGCGDGGVISV